MKNPKKEEGSGDAPFNMALATLERIHNLLQGYASFSLLSIGIVDLCKSKQKMCKQIYLMSSPLIPQTERKKIKENMLNLDNLFSTGTDKGFVKRHFTQCQIGTEQKIDDIVEDIEHILKKEGFFMPPKNDPRHSWSQS